MQRWLCGTAVALMVMVPMGANAADNPPTPVVVECTVDPLPIPAFLEIAGNDEPGAELPDEIPYVKADGMPADGDTLHEVMETSQMFVACGNAGDVLRMASLFSNEFIDTYFSATDSDIDDLANPEPLDDDERVSLDDVRDVVVLPDGTIQALLTLGGVEDDALALVVSFTKGDDGLLFDTWQPVFIETRAHVDRVVTGEGYTGAIFPATEAEAFIVPAFMSEVTGAWTPTAEDVAALELNLLPVLEASGQFSSRAIGRLPDYIRQYAGITVEGQQVVFMNAFCDDTGQDWTTGPVWVMDGGDCFFQLLFNPTTGAYSRLLVNGDA